MSSFIINENAFIEQAEYLNNFGMYVEHPMEKEIVKKLTSQGAKLIVGPRGVGKTTILLKAYQELISDESNVLPIYVNFKNSLKFEPLYKTKNNASLIFKQWLIASVLKELGKTLEELSSLKASYTILDKSYVLMKKLQSAEVALDESDVILMDEVVKLFEEVCVDLKKTRVIILMDDAAHAFSEEQQKDFFDFFREIKRTYISPKAAIYPGVTVFSSGFHVGHDAEELNLWLRVDDPSYLEFMQKILKVRLSESFFNYLFTETNLGPLLCYASFGIPRNLLNMTRDLLDGLSSTAAVGVKVADVFTVINSCHNANYNIYESLKEKLKYYSNYIHTGDAIFRNAIEIVKEYNKNHADLKKQSISFAIPDPISMEFKKVLGFLQYSGLIYPEKNRLNKGVKGTFNIFLLHSSSLINQNAVVAGKAKSLDKIYTVFANRSAHSYTRTNESKLLGSISTEEGFKFSIPPCEKCGTQRLSSEARFCHKCGAELKQYSVFEDLISHDLSKLSLTKARIDKIKAHSKIRTIKDILNDFDNSELRSVPMIGPVWSQRIFSYAEEYIS